MSDLLTVLILILSVALGIRYGFTKFSLTIIGSFTGLAVGVALSQLIIRSERGLALQVISSLAVIFIFSGAFSLAGRWSGEKIKMRLLLANTSVYKFDKYGGPTVGFVAAITFIWIAGWFLVFIPVTAIQRQVQTSIMFAQLHKSLPQKPGLITATGRYLAGQHPTYHLPPRYYEVREGSGPMTDVLTTLAKQNMDSVVKITGSGGASCENGEYYGTGFVISPGIVVTNTHVLGGLPDPKITDSRGTYPATPILFDRAHDVAVLRSYLLNAPPLKMAYDEMQAGSEGVVVGFPGGGDLTFTKSSLTGQEPGEQLNYYNGFTSKSIYDLNADIIPGNSGSPVISDDGKVRAIIFGYKRINADKLAMPTYEVAKELRSAPGRLFTADTSTCVSFHSIFGS